MNGRYGVPYMGSKNKLAERIMALLPSAPVLVDLFAGGCAISHAAMLSGKYSSIIANDLDGSGVRMFLECINGASFDERMRRFVDRDSFFKLNNDEWFYKIIFSYASKGDEYLYARETEPLKKALHYARILGDVSLLRAMGFDGDGSKEDCARNYERYRFAYMNFYLKTSLSYAEIEKMMLSAETEVERISDSLREYLRGALRESGLTQADVDRRLGTNGMAGHYFRRSQWEFPTREMYDKMREFMPLENYEKVRRDLSFFETVLSIKNQGPSIFDLHHISKAGSLKNLFSVNKKNIQHSFLDYSEVNIPRGAIIYADIPYKFAPDYFSRKFDHDRFFRWAEKRSELIILSEYIAQEGWVCIADMPVVQRLNSSGSVVHERLFVQKNKMHFLPKKSSNFLQPDFAF